MSSRSTGSLAWTAGSPCAICTCHVGVAGSGQSAKYDAPSPTTGPAADHMCQWSRSSPSSSTSPSISRTSSSVSPRNPIPSSRRTVLDPPSAPTTHDASSSSPSASASRTPASSWDIEATRRPYSTSTPSSASRSRSTCSVRHCGRSSERAQGVVASGSAGFTTTSCPDPSGSWRRIGSANTPSATSRSATPIWSSSSSVRGCMPLPRDPRCGPDAASTTRTRTARRASSIAAVSPVGPPPTTTTSSMAVTLRLK